VTPTGLCAKSAKKSANPWRLGQTACQAGRHGLCPWQQSSLFHSTSAACRRACSVMAGGCNPRPTPSCRLRNQRRSRATGPRQNRGRKPLISLSSIPGSETLAIVIICTFRIVAVIVMVLAAPFVALAGLAAVGLVGLYVHSKIIPAKSGEVFFPEIDTTVRLQFYYTWGDESGRFITVATPNGTIRGNIAGWDWAHYPRTCIFTTREGNIVVGRQGESVDYVANGKTLRLEPLWETGESPVEWKYMGAFDSGKPSLHFFPASDQAECAR
jgi:hypothetical protein